MEVRAGYKSTEIGVIPNDWQLFKVNDVLELLTDYDANGSFASVAENVNVFDYEEYAWYVRSTDLENNSSLNNVKFVDETSYKFLKKTKLTGGELLFLKRGDIGKVYLFKMRTQYATVAPNLYLLKINQRTKPIYLYYFFNTDCGQQQLKSKNASSTLGALYKDDVKSIIVPLPPLPEQTAIAEVLSDTDSLIQALEKQIAKKRNIKQGAMQKLLRPKEGWEVKKLGEIAKIVRGASPRPIEDPKWFDESSSIGWVRISDVTKSVKILTATTQKLSELGIQSSRYVEKGNLIMSICATVGRPILTRINVCIHDGFVVFRNPTIEKEYLYYFLSFIEKDWSKNGQTGSQMNLNTPLINSTEIAIPPAIEEQIRIATTLSDMDNELSALESTLEKYKMLKLGMMQNLLTGKIRLIKS